MVQDIFFKRLLSQLFFSNQKEQGGDFVRKNALWKYLLLYLIFTFYHNGASYAQENLKRSRWVKFQTQPIVLDSLTLVPDSWEIIDSRPEVRHLLSEVSLEYDVDANLLYIKNPEILEGNFPDSIQISYRVFPINFSKEYYNRSQEAFDTGFYKNKFQDLVEEQVVYKKEELFATPGLQKSGSLTRGISFGNTQNVFLNSALNLQLDGKLAEDLEIKASFSDQNVPFQPEGNTLQLQEFDKIFLELKHKNGALGAGDIVFKNGESEFLRYYKNVQGGQLAINLGEGNGKNSTSTEIGVAVAKGQFFSYQLNVIDGVSGPYKIYGPNNEKFIVIIANSEKVFLDGKMLKRGFNNDYVIDYNTGEITFTNKVLITKFSRVKIDFEYANQNYSRAILQGSHRQKINNLELFVSAYQEKDNKNEPLLFNLSDEDREILAEVGDSTHLALSTQSDTLEEFSPNRIIYTYVDTIVNRERFQNILIRAGEEDLPLLNSAFIEVGYGNGNYVLSQSTSNGRIYQWVAPENGIPQGNFEPGKILKAPDKKQMVTSGVKYYLGKEDYLFAEFAISNHNKNLFSELNKKDDTGRAFKVGYRNAGRNVNFLPEYKWVSGLDLEYNEKFFKPIDRFRPVEYNRYWSVNENNLAEDKILNAHIGIKKDDKNEINYQLGLRNRLGSVKGSQHHFIFNKSFKSIQVLSEVFLMDGNLAESRTQWEKINFDLSLQGYKVIPGYNFSREKNKVVSNQVDSIVYSANNFDQHSFYIKSNKKSKTKFNLNYDIRKDWLPIAGEFQNSSLGQIINFDLKRTVNRNQVSLNLTYRNLKYYSANDNNEETIMGRLDWSTSFLQKHIKSNLSVLTGSGRELKREFVYILVEPGRGTHTWRDENQDGIQDLNEFYLALNPEEMNYAKFFTPTDEYISAYTTLFNYRLNLESPQNWLNAGSFKSFFSRFSNISSILINNKISNDDLKQRFLPFLSQIPEESIISTSSNFRSSFFFNRKNPVYGLEFRIIKSINKQLLFSGFEERNVKEVSLSYRWNVKKKFNNKVEILKGENFNKSDFLLDRNYKISKYQIRPELSFQPSKSLRLTCYYIFKDKLNTALSNSEGEKANFHENGLSLRWIKAAQQSLVLGFKSIDIKYKGKENTAVGYQMLEALRPGQNFTWSANWIQKLTNGLQLNISYSGRKSPNVDIVHLGRMQVTALF
ncbi:hypothetical protein [Flexithrix dorotheae]|uniref:hypothetical protein n=1 Tax=Flexithrix dorotheae TaxID=70993 RepID=UPI0003607013|nr:hypothetical protein [Flexithrix dorotheae]